MRMSFATGLLAGVVLAALLVVASSYGQGPTSALGPLYTTAGKSQAVTQTLTTTSSSTSVQTPVGSINIPSSVSSLTTASTSTSASGNYTFGGAAQSAVSSLSASTSGPPSSLAVLVKQPMSIPLILIPVAFAAILGFACYRTSKPED